MRVRGFRKRSHTPYTRAGFPRLRYHGDTPVDSEDRPVTFNKAFPKLRRGGLTRVQTCALYFLHFLAPLVAPATVIHEFPVSAILTPLFGIGDPLSFSKRPPVAHDSTRV